MNRFKSFVQVSGLLLMSWILFSSCSETKEQEHYVVVLSMDGFRSDYPQRAHTPILDSLARVGVKAAFRPCYPSVTFPNHYSMATGLHPDHHGLVHNTFWATDLDSSVYKISDRKAVENPAYYGGEPIWNTAERQGVRTATYFWVGSETAVGGKQPSIWKKFDSKVPFMDRADSVIAWLKKPEKERPHLIMWYMEEPDHSGHIYSPDSSAVVPVIEDLDRVLAHFFNQARQLDIFKQIDFIFVSDHGMATYKPENYVNLGDYLPRDSFEMVVEGVPTLLYPRASYTEKAYEILKKVPNVTVWKKGEVPDQFVYGTNPRIGDLIVAPNIGTMVHFRSKEEASPALGGAHGYDNFQPEMEAIFYAAGPSFKQGIEAPAMTNVNLYGLIAHLLQIEPAPNDGDLSVVHPLLRLSLIHI